MTRSCLIPGPRWGGRTVVPGADGDLGGTQVGEVV